MEEEFQDVMQSRVRMVQSLTDLAFIDPDNWKTHVFLATVQVEKAQRLIACEVSREEFRVIEGGKPYGNPPNP